MQFHPIVHRRHRHRHYHRQSATPALGRNGLKSTRGVLASSAHSFAHLLALLTRLIAPHCTLCSRTLLRSFVCSLTPKLKGKRIMSMNGKR